MTQPLTQLRVERVAGGECRAHLGALAALRIAVFREYPYLYEGDAASEERYLTGYATTEHSCLVIARDGQRVVGASTAMPLRGHSQEVVAPLLAAGYDPSQVYYFGESVLLPAYRGRGLGHAFFDHREAAAREGGFRVVTFCAVDRPPNHPLRPAGYTPHDAFWRKRGFVRRPEITASFSWRDLGEQRESSKSMVFWTRELSP